jgi:valyl-tRNA synthetase
MTEIPKAYEPQAVEEKWYQFWLDQQCFVADPASKKPAYSIVIPPPNVTGMLHMGHVLNNTIQDILARKARMDGKEVLWLPGTDHAGIATQVQVERALKKEEHKTKYDLGREEFLKRVWAWKEKHGGIIINQLKKLGCSCDWTRERFTMDPEYSRCVQKVFVELYKKGLIYRGKRMVNWCPVSQTALSDEEVEMKPQRGFMYHFRVEVVEKEAEIAKAAQPLTLAISADGGEGAKRAAGPQIDSEGRVWLTIATTRPETIPADTAVAVNPKDPRYAHLIGKHVYRALPLDVPRKQRIIPIVADDHVDFEFGTGVLKVTPAHDKADFDIGQRHKLPVIDVLTPDAKMTAAAGADLAGLDRFVARKKAAEILETAGTLGKAEPYENTVGFSQRADVPIEPRLSEQWFLKYPSVEPSKACVAEGRMKFHPDRWAKVYDHWLTNIQDWCISRQLWWGHQIPVWRGDETTCSQGQLLEALETLQRADKNSVAFKFKLKRAEPIAGGNWTAAAKHVESIEACVMPEANELMNDLEDVNLRQDPDVLDTWFSSWLWPFATMGWTDDKFQDSNTPMLRAFYPTADLVTGPDIIFFWVARMIMAGYEFMGDLPFKNVYFTGIIRDKQGRKMSKTLGNSPDPLELIAKYGADALRFGTMRSAPLGQDVLFDEKDVELGRNFCNKLWNACRFRQMQGSAPAPGAATDAPPVAFEVQAEIVPAFLSSDDKWILLRLDAAIRDITKALASYNFSTAVQALYGIFWGDFCDWYLEAAKAPLQSGDTAAKANTVAVLDFVLSHMLRLFHPFLPFITEELWHGMGYSQDMPENQGGKTIMFAPWPKPLSDDEKAHYGLTDADLAFAEQKQELVTQGRNLRREANIPGNKRVKFVLKPLNATAPHDAAVLKILLNADPFDLDPYYQPPKGTPTAPTPLGDLFLPLEGLVDVGAEKARLGKEIGKLDTEIVKAEANLNNPSFVQKVPPAVLETHRNRLADFQAKRARLLAALGALSA